MLGKLTYLLKFLQVKFCKDTGTDDRRITAQKMKFSIKDFFSKCDQICSFLRILTHLLKKSLTGNLILCAVHNMFHAKHFGTEFSISHIWWTILLLSPLQLFSHALKPNHTMNMDLWLRKSDSLSVF